MSFFIQCAELKPGCQQHQDLHFAPALADVIRAVGISKLPKSVAELYKPFFANYEADEAHNAERHLSHLFKLAEKAQADLAWLGTAINPWLVVMDHSDIGSYSPYYELIQEFTCHTQLFSWPYIAFMRTQLSEAGLVRRM
jgi:hypothetical protein